MTEEEGDLGLPSFLSNMILLGVSLHYLCRPTWQGFFLVSCVWGPSGGPENTVLGLG